MAPLHTSIQYGRHTLVIVTGEMAKQASGSVHVRLVIVLAIAVGNKQANPGGIPSP